MSDNSTIQIYCVRISNFRGIHNMEITLPRVAVLVGPNNTGKTSILKALQLALGNYAYYISEEDFFISEDGNRAEKITVDVQFVPINGSREFDDYWVNEFGDKIQQGMDGKAFVGIRTVATQDETKGGFKCSRYVIKQWLSKEQWLNEPIKDKDQISGYIPGVQFFSIESQRDIYSELRQKTSYTGRMLSTINYNPSDIKELEQQIEKINKEAVSKSNTLGDLKKQLQQLNTLFQGKGEVSISPFPKQIRDLAKYFSIYFGDTNSRTFSMEYHGMGTRSWASILTLKAFIESIYSKNKTEKNPCLPVFALEEPEAHLHPTAQKTLYRQIQEAKGQVIISTHSPYFVSTAGISNIRILVKTKQGITVKEILKDFTTKEIEKVNREIISYRGDILFAYSWILYEGRTEEQVIPAMFEIYKQKSLFDLGVSCIDVGGRKNYRSFVKMAHNIQIPVYIISDNDHSTKKSVEEQIKEFKNVKVYFLSDDHDFEKELLEKTKLEDEIKMALIEIATNGSENEKYIKAKEEEINKWDDTKILERMRNAKTDYASFLSKIIRKNPNNKTPEQIIPTAILNCFKELDKNLRKKDLL